MVSNESIASDVSGCLREWISEELVNEFAAEDWMAVEVGLYTPEPLFRFAIFWSKAEQAYLSLVRPNEAPEVRWRQGWHDRDVSLAGWREPFVRIISTETVIETTEWNRIILFYQLY